MSKVYLKRAVTNIRYCPTCERYQGMVQGVCRVCGVSESVRPEDDPFRRYRR